jgi:hypothetical protein
MFVSCSCTGQCQARYDTGWVGGKRLRRKPGSARYSGVISTAMSLCCASCAWLHPELRCPVAQLIYRGCLPWHLQSLEGGGAARVSMHRLGMGAVTISFVLCCADLSCHATCRLLRVAVQRVCLCSTRRAS